MTYYLLLEGDKEEDALYDSNILGDESFGTFYPSGGFIVLNRIINEKPELLESIKILDDHKNSYTLTKFLDELEQWKIKS